MVKISQSDCLFAIIGGLLIGIATTLHLALKGRITGISGIFYSIITCDKPDEPDISSVESFFSEKKSSLPWKLSFISGMLLTSSIFMYTLGSDNIPGTSSSVFVPADVNVGNLNFVGFGISGLFVGFGTKLANGCTSGHGVCGLPRFSKRSWASVALFLGMGIIISTFRFYVPFLNEPQGLQIIQKINYSMNGFIVIILSIVMYIGIQIHSFKDTTQVIDNLITFGVGCLFSMGLGIGGMYKRQKIIDFLTISSSWDPQLLILLVTAVAFNTLSFYLIYNKLQKPVLADELHKNETEQVNIQLFLGSILFGIGWGLGALCPGPALNLLTQFTLQTGLVWIVCLGAGQIAAKYFNIWVKIKILENAERQKASASSFKQFI